jgi:hypothetical protein
VHITSVALLDLHSSLIEDDKNKGYTKNRCSDSE